MKGKFIKMISGVIYYGISYNLSTIWDLNRFVKNLLPKCIQNPVTHLRWKILQK